MVGHTDKGVRQGSPLEFFFWLPTCLLTSQKFFFVFVFVFVFLGFFFGRGGGGEGINSASSARFFGAKGRSLIA